MDKEIIRTATIADLDEITSLEAACFPETEAASREAFKWRLLRNMTTKIIIILLVINAITFLTYGIDKRKAKHDKWRIPEATLLLLAVFGGSIGAWLGMKAWHHKTMHLKFKYGVPVIFFIETAAALYLAFLR